jgi:hypothetical protein
LGGLIWAGNFGFISYSFRFSRDWPIIIVIIGLSSIWNAVFGRQWWGHKCCGRGEVKKEAVAKILEALEKGQITAEEAAKRMGDK